MHVCCSQGEILHLILLISCTEYYFMSWKAIALGTSILMIYGYMKIFFLNDVLMWKIQGLQTGKLGQLNILAYLIGSMK